MIKLLIKVKPGATRDEISLDTENNLSVRIKAKPIDGEANDYLVNYLAKEFNISRSKIQIEKGTISRSKRLAINIEQSQLDEILNKYKG
ncbi:MAG TPA: DUF167 domain-containing protein [Bacteroidia bacterium]|jgi:uncharacterized protein (TIGR00251 family)|nr:DUF167 domain-containing protein [Bacteroidia bacterium]